ncbi:beta-ketoacyl synthase N-terminal-like domain-containing protein [Teredinibacter turnerae]|uniref:beta-ketoacyl synthase N-terminal-like domain-containing protein n=1 Tax=Teredinibacter turnerae TaxID=2426 RepID=UPI00036CF45A|nr:beta-ketoacyl synthase N-terminal-like domain-containing protein [Teredinibacter turnerae]
MFQRRVVITGWGIVSPIGNSPEAVANSLKHSHCGIVSMPEYAALGMRSQVAGLAHTERCEDIPPKLRRFMGLEAQLGWVAVQDALASAGIDESLLHSERTGLIMGSGGASTKDIVEAADLLREKGIRKVGPYRVTATMTNTVSACLSTAMGIRGLNFSIASACATSAHSIGLAAQMVAWGEQDVVIAGGAEAEHWAQSSLFDAMKAMSSTYNEAPEKASRAYDKSRDGFVIANGAGALIVESLEHALARGANIIAEITGYGTASDGASMVAPSGEGSERAMRTAAAMHRSIRATPIAYINTHATSTPVGDAIEVAAMQRVFGEDLPAFSSTKSLTGHSLGAAGVHEAIYSLIMLEQGFMAAAANIDELDPEFEGLPLVREYTEEPMESVMSNSFGFGGTNVSLIFSNYSKATQ